LLWPTQCKPWPAIARCMPSGLSQKVDLYNNKAHTNRILITFKSQQSYIRYKIRYILSTLNYKIQCRLKIVDLKVLNSKWTIFFCGYDLGQSWENFQIFDCMQIN